ncbi:conserved hypothetical protein [Paecilomyces variotii No. 5]|uniref:Uncharacterized protein n=1 Tax=Byssochlamys spectabilis (strain No. 5 / NBRC 109023) TaxID=1356009 RepID=V5G4X1_BYSSN|nr:conserved hypothetical protein [Paecilomyces variotii No. 5]
MAYNAIAQVDHEVASNATSSNSGSPPPSRSKNDAFQQMSLDVDNLGGRRFMEEASQTEQGSSSGRLGSMIRSITSTSYDMLEEDDYEAADLPDQSSNSHQSGAVAALDTNANPRSQPRSPSPEPIIRSPSGHSIPLRHPTPDLQSLQGAYVSNVERLEKSAERLSMTSDIGQELRKMDQDLKRRSSASSARKFSSASVSNSIISLNNAARNGGYSPGGFVSSPRGSIMSGSFSHGGLRLRSTSVSSQLAQVREPEQEEEDAPMAQVPAAQTPTAVPILSPQPRSHPRQDSQPSQYSYAEHGYVQNEYQHGYVQHEYQQTEYQHEDYPDRPSTAASGDTYRQALTLFSDFDGVHCVPSARSVSLNRPPLASGSERYDDPQTGQNMVYYPAPVPMMLNLPPRLSQRPPVSEQEKRRTQLLGALASDNRKSVAAGVEHQEEDNQSRNRLSKLPPQLRASVFFAQPSSQVDVKMQNGSAVATLDSILDASAHAPVTAFTDHPFAGHVGSDVYKRGQANASSRNLADKKKKRKSLLGLRSSTFSPGRKEGGETSETEAEMAESNLEDTPLRSSTYDLHDTNGDHHAGAHSGQEESDGSEEGEEGEGDEDDELDYAGAPTTLLAELEMRKKEQKQRTRTAATAFPNGMHSTLLELDAVAQVQSKSRQRRPVTLAWEHPDVHKQDGEEDEDVPLGVLFPGKNSAADENRPLGLMEKRELEENEPLSKRRARLRGEPVVPRGPSAMRRASTMHAGDIPKPEEAESGDENETLAQRLQRLREEKNRTSTVISSDFASEVLAHFEKKTEEEETEKKPEQPQEETLGQRRRRLQQEAKARQSTSAGLGTPKFRRSMADILQAHPAPGARKPSQDNSHLRRGAPAPPQPQTNRMSMFTLPTNLNYATAGHPAQYTGYPTGSQYPTMTGYSTPFVQNTAVAPGMNGYTYSLPYYANQPMMAAQQPVDPRQRDVIDRWRQSVR